MAGFDTDWALDREVFQLYIVQGANGLHFIWSAPRGMDILYHKLVNGFFDRLYLTLQLSLLVCGNTRSDDRSSDPTGTPKSGL